MIEYYLRPDCDGNPIAIKIDIVPFKYKNLNYGIRFSDVFMKYYLFDLETGRYIAKHEDKKYLINNIERFYHIYEKYISDNPEQYQEYINQFTDLKNNYNINNILKNEIEGEDDN